VNKNEPQCNTVEPLFLTFFLQCHLRNLFIPLGNPTQSRPAKLTAVHPEYETLGSLEGGSGVEWAR
jgi:hypothetical protein